MNVVAGALVPGWEQAEDEWLELCFKDSVGR